MGRSPLVRRTIRAHLRAQDLPRLPSDTDGSEKPTFPRRFPRLGREFQTKIAKLGNDNALSGKNSRPSPDLMSASYPHLTQHEENNSEGSATIPTQSALNAGRRGYEFTPYHTKRGGLLLHQPSSGMVRFRRFVQPLFQSDASPPTPHVTEEAWNQQLAQLHSESSPKAPRSRNHRAGCLKRKRVEENLVWGLERIAQDEAQQRDQDVCRQRRAAVAEDDACALEYLHRRHKGDVAMAELSVLVDVSTGRATKVRKCHQKKLEKDKVKLAPPSSSESWRKLYERTFPSMLGKLQDDSMPLYPMPLPETDVGHAFQNLGMDLPSDADDLKGAWRSVLTCGKSFERQLHGDGSGGKKPLLSTLVLFIRNAYGLPTPESCFGSQHVMIEEVSNCFLTLLSHVDKARQVQAKLSDALYDESGDGVDVDALHKFLETSGKSLPIRLDEADVLYRFREAVVNWEGKVEAILSSGQDDDGSIEGADDLEEVRRLVSEARTHAFTTKSLVQLNARIGRAHQLRDRIIAWRESCETGRKNPIKLVSALVRDANRLKLVFPEVADLLRFHRLTESWVDRANIAVRSRISLAEIKSLIQRGESLPLDLSDFLEKLKSRVSIAEEWIESLNEVVPCPLSEDGSGDQLAWMKEMRGALHNGKYNRLHELASEGNRIPVEVEPLKLLQVELDAKNWALKAKKWIPIAKSSDSRRGKLDDIREHVSKAEVLRDRLTLSDDERNCWVLEGECELRSIVQAADTWLEKYKPFLEGDNRRSQRRSCISIVKLRQIVEEGNSIHANIGNATSKIGRILAQAEAWFEEHQPLLVRCHLCCAKDHPPASYVNLAEMTDAVESAATNVALDLDEAVDLKKLMKRIEKWFERATLLAPKRSKRQGRTPRAKVTVEDLVSLIEEASTIPVDTQEELKRLQMQLSAVQTWRSHASHELERIASGFHQLGESINLAFGPPKEFTRDRSSKSDGDENNDGEEESSLPCAVVGSVTEKSRAGDTEDQLSQTDSASTAGSEQDGIISRLDKGDSNVHRIIKDLKKGAKDSGVVTAEADLTDTLDTVSRWCARSLKYLDSPREVFDKRYFGAFDRFISEGNGLMEQSKNFIPELEQHGLSETLCAAWGGVVSDQLDRLEILRGERQHFTVWCDSAAQLLADEKKLTVEKLKDLADQSRDFPALSDMVQRVRGLSVKVGSWVASTKKTISSGKKLSMQDAKGIFDAGEKLSVNCAEMRLLRGALRAARGWANRVKRCNLEQGCIHVNTVKELIKEHGSFLIEMPEELSRLKQATRNYCICRRPYDGFMIGCDECDEWYHGACIGVSESRADRFDKYVCTRCSISNVYKNSASAVVGVIRKWTNKKDLKKARQVESQKHQRKVRKETKDIEKFRETIKTLETKRTKLGAGIGGESATGLVGEGESPEALTETETIPSNEFTSKGESTGLTDEDFDSRIRLHQKAIEEAEERLSILSEKLSERKQIEKNEEKNSASLRRWCLRVRSLVIVPSSLGQAQNARPLGNGSLSGAMCMVIGDAQTLGIMNFPDVDVVINAFRCMSWSLFTLAILRRKPSFGEINKVVSLASDLKLPEEKGLRTLKTMLQRGVQFQGKIMKALAPKPGMTKPYRPISVDMLKELASAVEELPLRLPEVARLQIALDDKGARHCICGGPSDGSFMLCCDKCECWFHGHCVDVTNEDSDCLSNWLCAECLGEKPAEAPPTLEIATSANFPEVDYPRDTRDDEDEEIPHAPDPEKMWPPFGLLGSQKATEALGECAAIPDDMCILDADDAATTKFNGRAKKGGDAATKASSPRIVLSGPFVASLKTSAAGIKRHAPLSVSPQDSGPAAPKREVNSPSLHLADVHSRSAASSQPGLDSTVAEDVSLLTALRSSNISNDFRSATLDRQAATNGNVNLPNGVAMKALPGASSKDLNVVCDGITNDSNRSVPMELEVGSDATLQATAPDINGHADSRIDNTCVATDNVPLKPTKGIPGSNFDRMEVDTSPEPWESAKSETGVVAMDVEDASVEARSDSVKTFPSEQKRLLPAVEQSDANRVAASQPGDSRQEQGPNCLHVSPSFAEISLDQSTSTTFEGRGSVPNRDEESSSGAKSEATDLRLDSMKGITNKEISGSSSTSASEKIDTTVARQPIPLPLGMKVEVKSSGCEANEVAASTGTSDISSDREYIEGMRPRGASNIAYGSGQADSGDVAVDEPHPAVEVAVLPDVLVAVKEAAVS